jgi:putative ABC transport system ATP-binding protein
MNLILILAKILKIILTFKVNIMLLELKNIVKSYKLGNENFLVLDWVNLEVDKWDFLSIMWPSWSWKSTLMNIIWMLDFPTKWEYFINWARVDKLSDSKQSLIRRKEIWFVFQNYSLIPRLSILEQVKLPLVYQWLSWKVATEKAKDALEKVWLWWKIKNMPNELSGWQKQRVAIARAIVISPSIILADEPTWALDTKTWEEIMKIFTELNNEWKTIIVITHEPEIAEHTKKIIHIRDGKILT